MNAIPPSSIDLSQLAIPEEATKAPFPPPSEPLQYRAIGIVCGRYEPSEERLTQGKLRTPDGVEIDAVLLGRVLSLVRKHLDLAVDHPWVVYPRTRDGGGLHTQIVGVWSMHPTDHKSDQDDDDDLDEEAEALEDSEARAGLPFSTTSVEGFDGFFSIRGEVSHQNQQEGFVLLKIRQQSKKKKPGRAFKLRLEGFLPDDARGKFWDLEVRRTAEALRIEDGTPLTVLPKKPMDKRRGGPGGGKGRPGSKFRPGGARGGFRDGGGRPSLGEGGGGGLTRPERPARQGFERPARPSEQS